MTNKTAARIILVENEARRAFLDGKPVTACPYPERHTFKRLTWQGAWWAALNEAKRLVQQSDPTCFSGKCTCRVAAVLPDRILIGGEADCPVHGYGPVEE